MLAQTRNEHSSEFQTTMCIYLLACGASQTQFDVLNIAFRVGEQRKALKGHFDNGTTATLIPLYDGEFGGLPLDLKPPRDNRRLVINFNHEDMLPSRQQVQQLEEEQLWHIEDILFDAFPALRNRFKDKIK